MNHIVSSVELSSPMLVMSFCHSATNTLQVMKQNIAASFPTPSIANSDITVMSNWKSYPKKWSHTSIFIFRNMQEI